MVNRINNSKINSLGQGVNVTKPKLNQTFSFQDALAAQLDKQPLKFSAHAMNRMQQRDVGLDSGTVARLENAVKRAAAKGARQSLVMLDEMAFVVSVTNKTVITALSGESRKENVFTNIDSAVIA